MVATVEEIAGQHMPVYAAMYQEVNPTNAPFVGAKEAAEFLKRSRLSKDILVKVWNDADSQRRGCLDKVGFFTALKLIALAQQGKEMTTNNVFMNVGPPRMLGTAKDEPVWIIKPDEVQKYVEIFNSLNPVNGRLSGEQVKTVFVNSGLPMKTLGKVWQLSDLDRDGYLDEDEMVLALHLIYRALENDPVPNFLTVEMIPPDKRHLSNADSGGENAFSNSQFITGNVVSKAQQIAHSKSAIRSRACSVAALDAYDTLKHSNPPTPRHFMSRSLSGTPAPYASDLHSFRHVWPVDAVRWEEQFRKLDTDADGFVTGEDVRIFFLQTGLQQKALAHIWNLCDIKCAGRLNLEQFALAMHLVQTMQQDGAQLPITLPVELIPPSFRPASLPAVELDAAVQPLDVVVTSSSDRPTPFSKEMEQVKSEIEIMQLEKREIEAHIVQSEADMKIKEAEIKNLEVEYNTLEATISQLKRQKVAAKQRLQELESQKTSLETIVAELRQKVSAEEKEWSELRETVESVCASAKKQQDEVEAKQVELQQLRDEERRTETILQSQRSTLDAIGHKEDSYESDIERLNGIVQKLKSQRQHLAEQLNSSTAGPLSPRLVHMAKNDEFYLPPLEDICPSISSTDASERSTGGPMVSDSNLIADPFVNADPFAQIRFPSGVDPFPQYPAQDVFHDSSAARDPFLPVDGPASTCVAIPANDPFQSSEIATVTSASQAFDPWSGSFSSSTTTAVNNADQQQQQQQKKKPPPRPALPTSHADNANNNPFSPVSTSSSSTSQPSFANFADFSKFA